MKSLSLLLAALLLTGCVSGGGGGPLTAGDGALPGVGPSLSTNFGKPKTAADKIATELQVVVPVFDPNLSGDSDDWAKLGIYPELRRAEANRFALKMKSALEDTDAFGNVKVVPSTQVVGDLYVIGKILESNGENVRINITATDISGKQWFTKNFSHRVKEQFHNNLRNEGKDPYQPVFQEAAAYVVKQVKRKSATDLARLQSISELRFAASLSEENFAKYLKVVGGRVHLSAIPADDDPALVRVQPMRVRHQLYIDRMQTHYGDFDAKFDESYRVWQEQSLFEAKAARKAKSSSIARGVLGGLLVVAGAVADHESGKRAADGRNTLPSKAAATLGGAAGFVLLGQSFQQRTEMKVHRDAFAELGKSIDIEVAPQVLAYENETVKLEGDSAEQYAQWIAFLKEIYQLEATPNKQLQ